MSRPYKRQINIFSAIREKAHLEAHLARMAEKGWMLEAIGDTYLHYREAEPCKKRFYVDLLPKTAAFDHFKREYAQLCAEEGWTLLAERRDVHIFAADIVGDADGDAPPPSPIHTDNRTQTQIYLKACRSTN